MLHPSLGHCKSTHHKRKYKRKQAETTIRKYKRQNFGCKVYTALKSVSSHARNQWKVLMCERIVHLNEIHEHNIAVPFFVKGHFGWQAKRLMFLQRSWRFKIFQLILKTIQCQTECNVIEWWKDRHGNDGWCLRCLDCHHLWGTLSCYSTQAESLKTLIFPLR